MERGECMRGREGGDGGDGSREGIGRRERERERAREREGGEGRGREGGSLAEGCQHHPLYRPCVHEIKSPT